MVGIKMDMPKNCKECRLADYHYEDIVVCQATAYTVTMYTKKILDKRHPKCPLRKLEDDK